METKIVINENRTRKKQKQKKLDFGLCHRQSRGMNSVLDPPPAQHLLMSLRLASFYNACVNLMFMSRQHTHYGISIYKIKVIRFRTFLVTSVKKHFDPLCDLDPGVKVNQTVWALSIHKAPSSL